MAKVINSNNPKFINSLVAVGRKGIEIGGFLGLGATKYPLSSITNFKNEEQTMIGKGTGGSLVGAGVGAVAFGGAGAVVGSVVGGNNKKIKNRTLSIEFNSQTWIIVEFDDVWTDNVVHNAILTLMAEQQANPFAS